MLSNKKPSLEIIIAGKSSGKPVKITPQAEPVYRELVKLARNGNHWARLTVNGINDLSSGRLHQNNIFIKPGPPCRGGYEEFSLILPGCKVAVEKLPSDEFKIIHFEADLNFSELQKSGERPGLYRSRHAGVEWQAKHEKSGKILSEKDRLVAISDRGYKDSNRCAARLAGLLPEAPFSGDEGKIKQNGFDMHFTPGEKKIGGLRNYKKAISPNSDSDLHESAILLAKTMYDAKSIVGVGWVSEYGGSGVLTQALNILADQGVELKKHTVFLYQPKTSPHAAIQAAHKVGLKISRKFSKTKMLNYIGNRDQLEVIKERRKYESDYKIGKAVADVVELGGSAQGVAALAGTLAAGIGVGSIAGPAAAMSFVAAVSGAAAAAGKVLGVAKAGNTLLENYAPKTHEKIKSKI